MELLHYILVVWGLIYILTQSYIGMHYRVLMSKLGKAVTLLVYCPACTGFWVGLGMAYVGLWPFEGNWIVQGVESGISGCTLGALWVEYGPDYDVFRVEQLNDNEKSEEESHGGTDGQ